MKEDDLNFIEQQLARLDVDTPPASPAPNLDAMFIGLVREERLWTPEEYDYIKHFHRHYGFNVEQIFHARAYEEWLHWHLLAVERYATDLLAELERLKQPVELNYSWIFSRSKRHQGSRIKFYEFASPMERIVPYNRAGLRQRGWHVISCLPNEGIVWVSGHGMLALEEEEYTVIFTDPVTQLDDLAAYRAHRERVKKKENMRRITGLPDLTVYPPEEPEDRKYSYSWEDGSLLPDGYMAEIFRRVHEREQKPPPTTDEGE